MIEIYITFYFDLVFLVFRLECALLSPFAVISFVSDILGVFHLLAPKYLILMTFVFIVLFFWKCVKT